MREVRQRRMLMVLVCTCSKKSKEIQQASNVGETAKQTGFVPLITHEGSFVWLCGTCFDAAHELAIKIQNIVKNRHLYFPGLLKLPNFSR